MVVVGLLIGVLVICGLIAYVTVIAMFWIFVAVFIVVDGFVMVFVHDPYLSFFLAIPVTLLLLWWISVASEKNSSINQK